MVSTIELCGLIPGDAPVPIDEVYIELFADEWQGETLCRSIFSQRGGRVSTLNRACISIVEMLNRTVDSCIVVGEPGAGKTTVLQWIAWAVRNRLITEIEHALLIPLRSFAVEFESNRINDLVSFWIATEDVASENDEHGTAQALRERGSQTKRTLMLLDGWDEIPSHLRGRIKQMIQKELAHFVIVLTSRATGLPRQVFPQHQTKIFEIAGLSPNSVREFVQRRLSLIDKRQNFPRIIDQIESSRDLAGMAANPFLLGLLVHILVSNERLIDTANRSEVYSAITNWILAQSEELAVPNSSLSGKHLECLENLAHEMVLTGRSPRYAFTEDELDRYLGGAASKPLALSRFIFRVDISHHLWSYLHATLEEYFAARGLVSSQTAASNDGIDRMLLSQTRLVCLEFFAGLSELTLQACVKRADHWLSNLDRYSLIAARLVRIAAAGGWKKSSPIIYKRIVNQLWFQITTDKDWAFARSNIEALAVADRDALVEKALAEQKLDARIQEALCDVLTPSIVKECGLWEKLHKQLKEYVVSRITGNGDAALTPKTLEMLGKDDLSVDQLRLVLSDAKQTGSPQVAEALLRKLRGTADDEQRDELVFTIATMFQLLCNDSLVDILTQTSYPTDLRKVAAKAICISPDGGQRIDPHIRSKLLESLSQLDKNDSRIEWILEALQSYPIRDGAQRIAELATDSSVNQMIRVTACSVLRTVTDDKIILDTLATLADESNVGMIDFLADLALYRRIRLPITWIEESIRRLTGDIHGRLSKSIDLRELLGVFLRLADQQEGSDRKRCAAYLVPLIISGLLGQGEFPEETALELSLDIRKLELIRDILDTEPQLQGIARRVLSEGVKSNSVFPGQLQLALELLRSDPGIVELLCNGFPQVIKRASRQSETRFVSRLEAVAQLMAEIVGEHDVVKLLSLADRFEVAEQVLRKRSQEFGLTIVGNNIYDVDGQLLSDALELGKQPLGADDITTLMSTLPQSYRNAVLSYWLVKQRFSIEGPKDVFVNIKKSVSGELSEGDTDFIQQVYGRTIPKYHAWRQAFYRGINQLTISESGRAFVTDLNLPRK